MVVMSGGVSDGDMSCDGPVLSFFPNADSCTALRGCSMNTSNCFHVFLNLVPRSNASPQTSRTAMQCLIRFQRSINPNHIRS